MIYIIFLFFPTIIVWWETEVGCAKESFLKYLKWIDKRTCVAPYYVDYENGKHHEEAANLRKTSFIDADNVERVKADFMEYDLTKKQSKYDLLLCSQVVEHVADPAAFMKKLINAATTSIISVPYDWNNCGKQCNHVSHHIKYETILEWSKPHVPIYSSIVAEENNSRRIIVVFSNQDEV